MQPDYCPDELAEKAQDDDEWFHRLDADARSFVMTFAPGCCTLTDAYEASMKIKNVLIELKTKYHS